MAVKTLFLSLMATSTLALAHTGRLHQRNLDSKSYQYIQEVCIPNIVAFENSVDSTSGSFLSTLHNSPFPCEQQTYILNTCVANDTTAIDYLAEQQCLCGSNFLEAVEGCNACYVAHGYTSDAEGGGEFVSSIWTAECSASPTQAFMDLVFSAVETQSIPQIDVTTTLENDRFPSQTAVDNYWTGARSAILGSITGSATARATVYPGSGEDDEFESDFPTSSHISTSRRANFSNTSPVSASPIASTSTGSSALDSPPQSTTPAPSSAPLTAISEAPSSASTSTNGGGLDMGLAWSSGVVLVVINAAVVVLL